MDIRTLNNIVTARAGRSTPEFVQWLTQHLESRPRCPIGRYLLACHCFDRGQRAQAVRHMMVAHHAEPAFESAALLVFAGLNWLQRRDVALLRVLLDTWEEFRRPGFDRHTPERRLLDAFAPPREELNGVSPLARRLWRLPIRTLRAQIREAVLSPETQRYPLLLAPA
jgi:hypothetical protein